jgi:uncharacterized protein YkwD
MVVVPRTRSSHDLAERSDANFGFKSGTTGIVLLVSLSIPKFVPTVPLLLTNFGIGTLATGAFPMIRFLGAARLCSVAIGAAVLFGCSSNNVPEGQPSFYQDLAGPAVALDAGAAQSMISGYRRNNGLGAVTIDPELMRLANEQATAMAARGTLDHNVGAPFQERIRKSRFDAGVAVENIGAGYHTLAEAFSGWRDSPPHRANMLNASVTRMGIAAVYAPNSKYKVFWALILAAPDERRS